MTTEEARKLKDGDLVTGNGGITLGVIVSKRFFDDAPELTRLYNNLIHIQWIGGGASIWVIEDNLLSEKLIKIDACRLHLIDT